jgi:hypothetical protein
VKHLPIAIEGLHQHGDTGLVVNNQVEHHLVEVWALIPTVATGDVNDMLLRRLVTVVAPIDMKTGTVEMGKAGRKAQALGRRSGNEAVEFGHAHGVQRIQGTPKRVIVEMAGLNAWGNEPRERFILEKMGHEVELLVDKAETIEHHRFHCMASGHNTHFRVLLRHLINNLCDAEFFEHARDQTQVIQDLRAVRLRLWRDVRAVRWAHRLLLYRGDYSDTPKLLNYT